MSGASQLTQSQRDFIAQHEAFHVFYARDKMSEAQLNEAIDRILQEFEPSESVHVSIRNTQRTLNGLKAGVIHV